MAGGFCRGDLGGGFEKMKGEYGGFGKRGWYHFIVGVACLHIAREIEEQGVYHGEPLSHAGFAISGVDCSVLDGMWLCL